jgi:Cu/Ag efflux pump CusA
MKSKKLMKKIQQANNVLQSKNVSIEAINEHMKLNEKLSEYGLSTHNIDELLKLVLNAKRYG